MPPYQNNPFRVGQRINEPADFIGRHKALDSMTSLLRKGSNVSVVGHRRIGKSSLLYHFYRTGQKRLGTAHNYQLVFLDMQSAEVYDRRSFVEVLLEELEAGALPDPEMPLARVWATFSRTIKRLGKERRIILLIDEFEGVLDHEDLNQDDFFDGLRSLCQEDFFSIATATLRPMSTLAAEQKFTSEFFNVFMLNHLEELETEEVAEFIVKYWIEGLQASQEELEALVTYAGAHPLFMQTLSFFLYENRQWQLPLPVLMEKHVMPAKNGFSLSQQQKLGKWLRQERKNLPGYLKTIKDLKAVLNPLTDLIPGTNESK